MRLSDRDVGPRKRGLAPLSEGKRNETGADLSLNSPFVTVHTRYFARRPAIGPVVAPRESEYAGSLAAVFFECFFFFFCF